MNLNHDAKLNLGTVALSGGDAAFSNVLNLGKTTADRMTVDVRCTVAGTGGTSIILKLQKSTDEAFTSPVDVVSMPSILLADLDANTVIAQIPIPPGTAGYLRVFVDVTGTFTAGTLAAQLNTYVGA